MKHQNLAVLNIAVIGNGCRAEEIASGLLAAGHHVYFGINEEQMVVSDAGLLMSKNVFVSSVEEAGAAADVIILACELKDLRKVSYQLNNVKTKVIIDCVPGGDLFPSDPARGFHTLKVISSITGNPHTVKWVRTSSIQSASLNMLGKTFVAGESRKAKIILEILTRDMGYTECFDLGGVNAKGCVDYIISHTIEALM